MTTTFTFPQEFDYPGELRPSLTIEVVPSTGSTIELPVILDTGASISKFDHAQAARMGVPDIMNTPRIIHPRTASNQLGTGYVHDVEIIFLGRTLTIPIAFVPSWPVGGHNLLGMEGFFEHAIFAFDHVKRTVYVRV